LFSERLVVYGNIDRNGNDEMKKHLMQFGIIFLLICTVLSGCNTLGETSIDDITQHPNNYLNKEVTIKGTYPGASMADTLDGNPGITFMVIDYSSGAIYVSIKEDIDTSMLITNGEYRFTGITKLYKPSPYSEMIYIDVSKIQPG